MPTQNRIVPTLFRRVAGVGLLLLLLPTIGSGVSTADTKDELDAAKGRYAMLQDRIAAKKDQLASLQAEASQLATQLAAAQARFDQIVAELTEIRAEVEEARDRFEALRERLDQRAREAFMGGTSQTMGVLLSSSSFAELSDRLEFVNELTGLDSDLAVAVNNLGVQLEQEAKRQETLRTEQLRAVDDLRRQQSRLQSHLASQEAVYDAILADERQAEQLVDELGDKYRREQAAAAAAAAAAESSTEPTSLGGAGPFSACPVPAGAASDDFGADRFSGGYHSHQGNDIFAAYGAPIQAPFDGTASGANNSLGGIAVIVTGSQGYVYNAHMSKVGKLGAVQAGDIIGYVGTSGNAQGTSPHDHFEWHPGNGDAVDPHPYILQAC